MSIGYYHIKRCADAVLALTILLVFSWLFLLIVLIYLLTGHSSFFFIQERIGKNDAVFRLYKFKTLRNLPGSLQERRFRLGDIMRFTSLDELPQLINVLKGEMSLIGPRPLPTIYLDRFDSFQRQRHKVLPGITGWAQVNGRNLISWQDKFNYDVYYVKNCSLVLDLTIILKTVILLLSFRKDHSLNEQEFTGKNNE